MLEVEGYKMFYGIMKIFPKNAEIRPYTLEGTWLYKPEYKCWCCSGWYYPEDICSVITVFHN